MASCEYASPSVASACASSGCAARCVWRSAIVCSREPVIAIGAASASGAATPRGSSGRRMRKAPDAPSTKTATATSVVAIARLANVMLGLLRWGAGGGETSPAGPAFVWIVVRAGLRQCEVRERALEVLVVRVHVVTEARVLTDQDALDDLDRNIQDIVGEATAVREPGVVSTDHAKGRAPRGAGRDRHVQPEFLARGDVRGLVQSVDTGQEHAHQIAAWGRRRGDAVDSLDQACQLRIRHVGQELPVVGRLRSVPLVLLPRGDDDLVDERHAQP